MAEVEYEDQRGEREKRALSALAELNGNVQRLSALLEAYGPSLIAVAQQRGRGAGPGLDALLGSVSKAIDSGAMERVLETLTGAAAENPPRRKKGKRRRGFGHYDEY